MRNEAREVAFIIIFANQFHENCNESFRSALYRKNELSKDDIVYCEKVVNLVQDNEYELMEMLTAQVKRFADYRIFAADKAVMLIALAEIKFMDDIPPVVSVSEATSLAKKYSTENSAGFVNGVLGGIINA